MQDCGFDILPFSEARLTWAKAAADAGQSVLADPDMQAQWLRHGQTWFVGVDALPTDDTGAIGGVPLPVEALPGWHGPLHKAQLSVVYPGYPGRDDGESDAAHRFRRDRFAAHIDGLLPIGPEKRRYLKEPHAFILGLPLNDVAEAPLTVWPGSHRIMGEALTEAVGLRPLPDVDLTEIYQATRRRVFDRIAPVPLRARPGEAVLLHRHILHGIAPWNGDGTEPRMMAYFRPEMPSAEWLTRPDQGLIKAVRVSRVTPARRGHRGVC